MSEPMYLLGDHFGLSAQGYSMQEVECDCGSSQEVEAQEYYKHSETLWYAEWSCIKCGQDQATEGWY